MLFTLKGITIIEFIVISFDKKINENIRFKFYLIKNILFNYINLNNYFF